MPSRAFPARWRKCHRVASAIAAAVEQQGAATRDIANTAANVAHATDEANSAVARASHAVDGMRAAIRDIDSTARDIAAAGTTLDAEVTASVARLKAA